MAKYTYGKSFRKNGKLVRYRYTNGRASSKKLVAVSRKKPFRAKRKVASKTRRSTRRTYRRR